MALDIATIIFIIVLCTLFIISVGVTIFIVSRFKWPFTYIVIEDVAGLGSVITRKGRCRMIGFGDGGEEIFYLKNIKKWRASYGKRIAPKQIAWQVGQDGFWYNITFGNLDKKLRELGVMPVDRDMRYAYASIRKGIENRYNEKTFFEKWGSAITIGMLIIAIIALSIGGYFMLGQVNKGIALGAENAKVTKDVMQLAQQVLSGIDNIKNGGSGLIKAT